ncbi:MAG: ABC transporter ATP-binding protein [Filifactoraceae bacterium]
MKKLLKYLKGSWIFAILAPCFMMVEVAMDLQLPTLMSKIVDVGVASQDISYIYGTGRLMLLFTFIGMIGGLGSIIFSSLAAFGFGTRLRQATFDKIHSLSFKEIDELKTSSLITRLTNDITQVQNLVLIFLRMMVRAPLLVIGGIIMASSISPKLAIIFMVGIPILVFSILIIIRQVFGIFIKIQGKTDRVNTVMRENLLGAKVIKAFVGRDREIERFKVSNEDLMDTTISAQKIIILLFPIFEVIMNLSIVAIMWFGGNMIIGGSLETGKVMAFLNYLIQIFMSLIMMIMLIVNYSRAIASATRINEIHEKVNTIVEPMEPKIPTEYNIEFRNVSFGYNEGDKVLEEISLSIHDGEKVGIIGGTGSGKSSFVMLIPRLYDVNSGEIKIGGINIKDIPNKNLMDLVGFVMQDSVLLSGTVEENLRLGAEEASSEQLNRAIEGSGSKEFILKLEEGLDSVVSQRGKNFSGGQRQRLSIARALAKKPKILILDDSTSAVDIKTEKKIQEFIKEYKATTLVIAQRISSIAHLDKIIVFEEGRVIGIGSHQELIKTNEIYRLIAISQLGEEAVKNV